jgi:undecaprenyl-diphosphatase
MSVTLGQAVLLGIVQGLTEFLPVSSTTHLALAQRFLPGFAQPGILFDVLLHVGTLLAVVVYFRSRIVATYAGAFSTDRAKRQGAWKLIGLLVLAVALTGLVTLPRA